MTTSRDIAATPFSEAERAATTSAHHDAEHAAFVRQLLVDTAAGRQAEVRVPFGRRLAERAEVRTEVARLFYESQAALEQG